MDWRQLMDWVIDALFWLGGFFVGMGVQQYRDEKRKQGGQ